MGQPHVKTVKGFDCVLQIKTTLNRVSQAPPIHDHHRVQYLEVLARLYQLQCLCRSQFLPRTGRVQAGVDQSEQKR